MAKISRLSNKGVIIPNQVSVSRLYLGYGRISTVNMIQAFFLRINFENERIGPPTQALISQCLPQAFSPYPF